MALDPATEKIVDDELGQIEAGDRSAWIAAFEDAPAAARRMLDQLRRDRERAARNMLLAPEKAGRLYEDDAAARLGIPVEELV
jgi:hypothetical protein